MSEVSEQAKAIRRAVSGQDEEPVTLETDGVHEHPGDAVRPDPSQVSPDDVLKELEAADPQLLELLACRVAIRQLQAEVARLGG